MDRNSIWLRSFLQQITKCCGRYGPRETRITLLHCVELESTLNGDKPAENSVVAVSVRWLREPTGITCLPSSDLVYG